MLPDAHGPRTSVDGWAGIVWRPSPGSPLASDPRRAQQHATRAAFFIPGFVIATWAPLVPFAKLRTGLDDAGLGLAPLCPGMGSLLAMRLALAVRQGCRRLMLAAGGGGHAGGCLPARCAHRDRPRGHVTAAATLKRVIPTTAACNETCTSRCLAFAPPTNARRR